MNLNEFSKANKERYCLPVKKYPRLLAWLLRLLQRRCEHWNLKADILEACSKTYSIRWCATCGAYSIVTAGAPSPIHLPEPTWE